MEANEQALIYALAYEEARRSVEEQGRQLDQLRLRMMAVLTSATTASAFLVGVVMHAAKADQRWWYWFGCSIGATLYGVVLVNTVLVLRPRYVWHNSFSAKVIISGYADHEQPATLGETQKKLAEFGEDNIEHNEKNLGRIRTLFEITLYVFVLELVVWCALAARVG